jgi:hypothetical protein
MNRKTLLVPPLLLLTAGAVLAADPPAPKAKEDPKQLDGISILGNQEAPKALVIVPWKSSELGAAVGIAPMLDDSRSPVDRDVFLRALSYYEIRSETAKRSKS